MAADELFDMKLAEVHPFGHEDGRLFSRKARLLLRHFSFACATFLLFLLL